MLALLRKPAGSAGKRAHENAPAPKAVLTANDPGNFWRASGSLRPKRREAQNCEFHSKEAYICVNSMIWMNLRGAPAM
jgi:hypothetical protein